MEHNPQTGSTRDFLTILFKHKYKILTVFLATVITVTVGSFLLPPVFEAKSSLIVKMGREYMYSPEVGDAKSSTPSRYSALPALVCANVKLNPNGNNKPTIDNTFFISLLNKIVTS